MPNWAHCTLTIKGNQEDLDRFKKVAAGEKSCFDLEQFIPMPRHLSEPEEESCFTKGPVGDINASKAMNGKRQRVFPGWYAWSCRNWGCKWNVDGARLVTGQCADGVLVYRFDTPWSPPDNALHEIARQFDSLEFELSCSEEQMNYWTLMFWKHVYNIDETLSCTAFKDEETSEEHGFPTQEAFDARYGAMEKRFHEKIRLLKSTLTELEAPTRKTTLKDLIYSFAGSAESKDSIYEILRRFRRSDDVTPDEQPPMAASSASSDEKPV